MELRQLRYFVAVAEELHFRRAAARLNLSQPPLSHQIRALEDELGYPLLVRSRQRVQTTAAGEALLRDARALLLDLDRAVDNARRVHEGQAGRLRISFVGSALLSIVPQIVRRFRGARPRIDIELRERSTADQLMALASGDTDLGLAQLPIGDALVDAEVLRRERMIAAIPSTHPLAALRRVSLRRLAEQPFVLFPRDQAPGFYDRLVGSLTGAGTPPRIIQYAPEMQTIIGLVASGIGVSLVPASVQQLALDGVVYRPVSQAPHSELAAISRPGERSPLVQAFLAEARAVIAASQEGGRAIRDGFR